MGLDVSGAESLVYDLQRTSNEYRAYDPNLAEEIALKAHEICREFGIDPAMLDQSVITLQDPEAIEQDAHTEEATPIADDQVPYRSEAADIQLQGILDRQREMTDGETVNNRRNASAEQRSSWPAISSLLGLQTT